MRDISKKLTVINTEKKNGVSESKGQSSAATYVRFGEGGTGDLKGYLLKSIWDRVWEIRTDSQGAEYIFGKLPVVTQYGITMYSGGNVDIPTIAEGLPFDQRTIWFNPTTGQIEVIGGTGGGNGEGVSNFWELSGIPSWITNTKPTYSYSEIQGTPDLSKYALVSQIPSLNGYATVSDLDGRINALINGAPQAYDTLKEIADVLQGNVSSIGDIITTLGNKANKATTLSGYGITDAYTKTNVDRLLGGYLPLTGGTLSGYTEVPLILKGTYSDNVLLHLHNKSNIATSIGKYGTYTFLANYANGNGTGELEIHDDGRLTYATSGNNYSIWHEGNFTPSNYLPLTGGELLGKLQLNNGNDLELKANSSFPKDSGDIVFMNASGDEMMRIWFHDASGNAGIRFGSSDITKFLLHTGNYYNYAVPLTSYTAFDVLTKLKTVDGSESGLDADLLDGKQLSDILASNVASATKLQTTRYIWGRSFDGTGNITGDLEMGNNIILKQRDTEGNSLHTIYTSTSNNLVIGNGHAVKGYNTYLDGNTLFFRYGTAPSMGMILNSSGNVTIGSSDLASTNYKLYVDGLTKITSSTNIGLQIDSSYKGEVTRGVQVLNPSMPFGDSNGVVLLFGQSTSAYNCGNIAYRHHGENNTNNYVSLGLYGKDNILVCKANGNVGIDSLNPTAKLHVNGTVRATNYIYPDSLLWFKQGSEGIYIGHNAICWHNSGAAWVSNLIGFESNKVTINQSTTVQGDFLSTGGITMYSARKLKNIVDERGLSLEELSVIKPTRFTWKDGRDSKIHIGGIADDVMEVLPEVIYKTGEDDTLTMDYGNAAFAIAASLIKPVISHEEEIKALKKRIKELEEQVKTLSWNIA